MKATIKRTLINLAALTGAAMVGVHLAISQGLGDLTSPVLLLGAVTMVGGIGALFAMD